MSGYFNSRPREGGDGTSNATVESIRIFQSTPPARGATHLFIRLVQIVIISIHTPREGGDAEHPYQLQGDS